MGREKITIIGAGHVGGTTAQRLAEKNCYDVVLLDIIPGLAKGKALDLVHAAPICGYDGRVIGTDDYKDTADSSLVVITSGVPRKPGMSRDELVETNVRIVQSVVRQVVEQSPDAVLIVVSNPLDAMAFVAYTVSGFSRERVLGMGGVLDTARFRAGIAKQLHVSVRDVHAMVLGSHGDSMVPLVRQTTVAGVPVHALIAPETLDRIVRSTQRGGAEIVECLKTGSAYVAPSAAIVEMVEAVMRDCKVILPCAAFCNGEYGIQGIFIGVPVKLGRRGGEEIIQMPLAPEEHAALHRSTHDVKELCRQIEALLRER